MKNAVELEIETQPPRDVPVHSVCVRIFVFYAAVTFVLQLVT